jgi:hypothetical protein
MDSEVTWKRMCELAAKIEADYYNHENNGVDQDDAVALAQYTQALAGWVKSGGFVPEDFKRNI